MRKLLILRQRVCGRAVKSADSEFVNSKGAVLLIAILVASVALAVGLGVYNRTYKELIFASYWKQTQVAFAVADSGLECALFFELHPAMPVTCFNVPVGSWSPSSWTPGTTIAAPGTNIDIPGGGCVNLRITSNGVATTTEARGYNDACGSTNPRRVERGLNISY